MLVIVVIPIRVQIGITFIPSIVINPRSNLIHHFPQTTARINGFLHQRQQFLFPDLERVFA